MKVDRPADETMIEGATEVVGAWSSDDAFFFFLYIVLEDYAILPYWNLF